MLSPDAQNLLYFLSEFDQELKKEANQPKVSLTTTVGFFAFIYEKIRNLVDYQEEHLLLRRAITRILIRLAKTQQKPQVLIEGLVRELFMARYLEEGSLSQAKVEQAAKILEKYFLLLQNLGRRRLESGESLGEFLFSLAAREIEELFVPTNEDYLLTFALKQLEKRIIWIKEADQASQEEKTTRLLVGLMRALAKYDDRTVYYKLWKLYFPDWKKGNEEAVFQVVKNFSEADEIINRFLREPWAEPLVRLLKKQIAPFEILNDLINRGILEIREIFSSPEKLAKAAAGAADSRYWRAKNTLRRSAFNSFVYIFITKMIFALAVEVPYELLVASQVNYLPILINLLFPPSLMLFMTLSVETPKAENTQKIVKEILAMTFNESQLEKIRVDFSTQKSTFLANLFRGLYALTFILTFGLTLLVLKRLRFSLVSQGIFFFFLSSVSFFAYRIRSAFKELVVGEEEANLISHIFDFFMLPFVRLGRAISTGLREINFFTFFFDIILEAPFKMVLEIIEEWTKFLKEKKEETLNIIK